MFAVLKISERDKGFLNTLKEYITPPEPEIRKVAVRSGAPFFIIKVKKKKSGVPWDDILYAAGRCSSKMIFTGSERPPDGIPIYPFEPRCLPFIMLLNTVCAVIEKTKTDRKPVVGIYDRNAVLKDVFEKLLPLSSVIAVTDREDEYGMAAGQMFKKYGASIPVGNDISLTDGCDVIICPNAADFRGTKKAVFAVGNSLDNGYSENERILLNGDFDIPDDYAYLLPNGAEKLRFVSALYELCGARALRDISEKTLFYAGNEINLYKTAEIVDKSMNEP
ncbi:MAG: hypothetical protein K6F09_06010 [Clostridiales bacterium]|nr:hypothetical protein [Clostridiales bacterium]